MSESAVIRRCLDLCEIGFTARSAAHYREIAVALEPYRSDKRIVAAIRLAQGGASLASPRFAYPHIASQLRERLREIAA